MMRMYLKNCLCLFGVICVTTFILNYSVVKNLQLGMIKKSFVITRNVGSDTLSLLKYRRTHNPFVEDNITDFEPGALHIGFSYHNNTDPNLFNCSASESVGSMRSGNSIFGNNNVWEKVNHNQFTFLIDFAPASRTFDCNESITYTTHGEFRYLDNLVPLVERWEGPISIALYTPGTDLRETTKRIHFLRECTTPLIKQLVSFHLFFDSKFSQDTIIPPPNVFSEPIDCADIPSFNEDALTYRKKKRLTYPVNVARNLARNRSTTYFVLPSDIELYPSLNIIPYFLDMIERQDYLNILNSQPSDNTSTSNSTEKKINPRVFVLPIFEVEDGYPIPDTKEDLKRLLQRHYAVPFHKYVCPECHKVPKYKNWVKGPYVPHQLNVFHTGKRQRPFQFWEPIYIGTNLDPFYDERLSWEGLRDKMSQGYTLCILDYDFMILDNAFLVHRPGIKKKKRNTRPTLAIRRQNRLLSFTVQRELHRTYGKREGCLL